MPTSESTRYRSTKSKLFEVWNGKNFACVSTGRKSGKQRTLPLIGVDHGDGWGVIASASGHDAHPAWYLNLEADPQATVTVGKTEHSVVARTLEGEERQQVWDQAVEAYPDYAEYQKVTDRVIPVLALEPA